MKQNKIQKIKHLTSNEQIGKCKTSQLIVYNFATVLRLG